MTGPEQDRRTPDEIVLAYMGEFAQVLPSHFKPETFVRLAVGALRRDAKLMAAANTNPLSLMQCLMEAARLGLEPGTKEYWLIPRRLKGRDTVTGFPGFEGYIELMYRAGAVTSVKAELVFAGDRFDYSPDMERPIHKVNWFAADRGALLGAYAYAEMVTGGTSRVVVVGPREIARAKASSAGADRADSPWVTDPGAMYLKTGLRQLQKWVPTSAEYRREQLRAVATVAAEALQSAPTAPALERPAMPALDAAPMVDEDGVITDAQVLDPEEVQ